MPLHRFVRQAVDLTDPACNQILNMTVDQARACVAADDPEGVRRIDGPFALVARVPADETSADRDGPRVRMARSLGVPLRYFIAKLEDGPALIVANRMDAIAGWLKGHGLADQYHPSYTRMVPAHHVTEVALVGCPDPNPVHRRFFAPERNRWAADVAEIGRRYMAAVDREITRYLERLPADAPIGVCFSGGVDSGAVLLLTYHALLRMGQSPARLKAFTLAVEGGGRDLEQAWRFVRATRLEMLLEPIEVPRADLDVAEAIRIVEDYKPLDVQAAAMLLALARGIRRRYPDWADLLDGDGGDENLKDYPIEENPELTIRSVLNNRMLYQEGWGVDCIKHSLTYSGGLSRGCTRTYAPLRMLGFTGFSPFTLPHVVEVAEGIPFAQMTGWETGRLYELKGSIVAAGVEAVTGIRMPVFAKRRFQHGAADGEVFPDLFPGDERGYRRVFLEACEAV